MKELTIINGLRPILLDDEDFERISKFHWRARGHNFESVGWTRAEGGGWRYTAIANEVLQIYGVMFDHKNRDGYDNQKNNLRQCNYSQNRVNTPKLKGCSSQYKGVCRMRDKWMAKINFDYEQIYLGLFVNEIDAAKRYDTEAKKLYGDFAVLNFPNMRAVINITTPAGKSLEGYPKEVEGVDTDVILFTFLIRSNPLPILHPGDKITIEILP